MHRQRSHFRLPFLALLPFLTVLPFPPLLPLEAQEPSAQPSFRTSSSELVVVPATVLDKRGQLIRELTSERFRVYDNGRPQPIVLFNSQDIPVSIALVIDDSGSMRQKF